MWCFCSEPVLPNTSNGTIDTSWPEKNSQMQIELLFYHSFYFFKCPYSYSFYTALTSVSAPNYYHISVPALISRVGIISLTFTFNKCPRLSTHTSSSWQAQTAEIWSAHSCIDSLSVRGLCVSEHMHVCVGGVPHTLLFSCESWEEGMSASQLSSAARVMEERRGSSLFFSNILPSVTCRLRVCACLCLGVTQWWYSPLLSTALASHAYLTLQMQSFLLSSRRHAA